MTAADHPSIDSSHAPVYVIRAANRYRDEELAATIADLDAWYETIDGPFALVFDARRLESMNARQRRMIADAEVRNRGIDERWNCGQAYVISSVLVRGALVALMLIQPPTPYPTRTFSGLEEALAWARDQVERRTR